MVVDELREAAYRQILQPWIDGLNEKGGCEGCRAPFVLGPDLVIKSPQVREVAGVVVHNYHEACVPLGLRRGFGVN